jgi:hypothetical protein
MPLLLHAALQYSSSRHLKRISKPLKMILSIQRKKKKTHKNQPFSSISILKFIWTNRSSFQTKTKLIFSISYKSQGKKVLFLLHGTSETRNGPSLGKRQSITLANKKVHFALVNLLFSALHQQWDFL